MNSKISLLIIGMLGIIFMSYPANASLVETFNETFLFAGTLQTQDTIGTFTGDRIGGNKDGTIAFVTVNFNNVKLIKELKYHAVGRTGSGFQTQSTLNTAQLSRYTPFTATISGGSSYGSGTIGWTKVTQASGVQQFYYDIIFESINTDYAKTLTGEHNLTFVYDPTVFTSYINPTTSGTQQATSYTYAKIYVNVTASGADFYQPPLVTQSGGDDTVITQWSDTATLSFKNDTSTDFGYVNVSKGSTNFQTQTTTTGGVIIQNITSTSDFSDYENKTLGLKVNTRHILSGDWANRTVYTTVAVTPVPTPTPSPIGGGGSSSGQIYFDLGGSTIGSKYGINTSISSSNFSAYNKYFIDTFDPAGIEVQGFPVQTNTQNYSTGKLFTFKSIGTYYSNLSYCSSINILCPSILSPTQLDTAYMTVTPVSATFNVTTDKANYVSGDNIVITANNPSLSDSFLTAYGNTGIVTDIAWNTKVDPNSVKVINATINSALPIGTYYVNLAGSQSYTPLQAQAIFNITTASPNTNTLSLGWNDAFFGISQTGILSYVSNFNQSTLTIYNQNLDQTMSTVSTINVPANGTGNLSVTFTKSGLWFASLQDKNTTSNMVWANTSIFSGNPSDAQVQANCKSSESYACWDKSEYNRGEAFVVNYKVVTPSFITYYPTLQFIDPSGTITRSIRLNYSVFNNTITGQITGAFSSSAPTGVWFVRVEKINQVSGTDDGEITSSATKVLETVSPTATPLTSSTAASNITNLLTSNIFWAFLFIIGIMLAIAIHERKGT